MSPFDVKITNDSEEIRASQRLRFDVFNRELRKGLRASHELGLDSDPFGSSRGEETLNQSLKHIFGAHERKEPRQAGGDKGKNRIKTRCGAAPPGALHARTGAVALRELVRDLALS